MVATKLNEQIQQTEPYNPLLNIAFMKACGSYLGKKSRSVVYAWSTGTLGMNGSEHLAIGAFSRVVAYLQVKSSAQILRNAENICWN